MRTVSITCEWVSTTEVEVEEDVAERLLAGYRTPTLDKIPQDVLDQLNPTTAELVNWSING